VMFRHYNLFRPRTSPKTVMSLQMLVADKCNPI
jgi:hypothetical protein